jgi:hypothetical protein
MGHDEADDVAIGIDPEVCRVGAGSEIGIQYLFTVTGRRQVHKAEAQAVLQYAEHEVIADLIRGHRRKQVSRDQSRTVKLATVQEQLGKP